MKTVLVLFGELTDFDLDWLMRQGAVEEVRCGALLLERGRPVRGLYIILDGLFEIVAESSLDLRLGTVGVGEVLGASSLVESAVVRTSVRAVAHSVVFALPREALSSKSCEDSGFAERFHRAIDLFLPHGRRPLEHERVLAGVYLGGKRFERMLKKVTMT